MPPNEAQSSLPIEQERATTGGSPVDPNDKHLPEANEFSPGQVTLEETLELVYSHAGNRSAIVEALRARFFADSAAARSDPAERLVQQQKRASNVLIGMKGYGLFDLAANVLTPTGTGLRAIADGRARADAFASHILKRCEGLEVLDAVRAIQLRHERATKQGLAAELRSRGYRLPTATTHHTKVLQWLREAGVIDREGNIDEEVVGRLVGVSLGELDEWRSLTPQQQAFLRTLLPLVNIHGTDFIPVKGVIETAEFRFGRIFKDDQLRAQLYRPLEERGWIQMSATTGGRGGKSGYVAATEKLAALDLDILPVDSPWMVPPDLRVKLNTPLDEIYGDLDSESKNVKGIALELLALRIALGLGLTPLRFRLRAKETGGAEVDLVAEAAQLHFSRWLFQCKNTATVHLADLAKEVGMAVMLRAHVIVLVTTGRFSASVGEHANELAETHHLQAVLIDGKVLTRFKRGGNEALLDVFHDWAGTTMRLKRIQLDRDTTLE